MLFLIISAIIGLAMGLSDAVLANYFKEAYSANAQQRGFIELPRELPGILSVFFLAAISFLGNIRSAMIAQLCCVIGTLVLGFYRPSFAVMLIFLFIYSTGVHMYLPLNDSIGLSLSKDGDPGRTLGRFNSVRMAFLMIAGVITFVGFKINFFSFDTPVLVFILSAAALLVVFILFMMLSRAVDSEGGSKKNTPFILRKAYIRYYVICMLYGGRKQIMLVYSPWVLIDLLGFRADAMSILAVISAFVGVFFMPLLGRWIDKYGAKKVMIAEASTFISVYVIYGFLCRWVVTHDVVLTGVVMILVYLLNIIDRMTIQFSIVRSIYMRSLALMPEDVTPSLTMGMAIDHVIAIGGSIICGSIWLIFGPEYVFIVAAVLSVGNMITAMGIKTRTGNRI